MIFSSPIFLFGFLPIALLIYYLSPGYIKNTTLLIFSLIFYAWGEVFYIGVMIASIISNYVAGNLIYAAKYKYGGKADLLYLGIGVSINIALLFSFKYANFVTDNINYMLEIAGIASIDLKPVHLPLGISFFTFQAVSYIVDIYRDDAKPQKNIFNLALYISLFPQLIAGPIVRYSHIARQITSRNHSIAVFSSGAERFIYGLSKKMLIANPLGEVADTAFLLHGTDLTMPLAWIGVLAYTLQIYFDFSGYSDMAIGLGRMFGFRFRENFNYPYISTSIREFWRRWHISLSTWFRDYVYFPLGGNRVSTFRVYLNLLIVFVLTGFWHGASWNFVVWGLFHGLFLAAEHAGFSSILTRAWKPLQHIYLLIVVVVGWVLFRSDTLTQAIHHIATMFNIRNIETSSYQLALLMTHEALIAFLIGGVLSTPVYAVIADKIRAVRAGSIPGIIPAIEILRLVLLFTLMFLCVAKLSSSTYNPFIYFRF